MWIVAADLQSVRAGKPCGCIVAVEEGAESLRAPGSDGFEDAFGVVGFGRKRVVEELFQVPAQLAHEVGAGQTFYGDFVRRGYCNWR